MYALLGIALSCFACCVLFCACSAFAPCAFAIFLRLALCAWILRIGQGECGYCALDMAPVDITRCDMARVLNIAQHKAHRYCAHTARNALYLLRTRRWDPASGAGTRHPAPVALFEAYLLVRCCYHFDAVIEEHRLGYTQILPWMMAAPKQLVVMAYTVVSTQIS